MSEKLQQTSSMNGFTTSGRKVSKANVADTLLALKDVILPTLAKGPLIRRRKFVTFAERHGVDDKAVRRMQSLRHKYGAGPLVLAIPLRSQALLLAADDVRMVLELSPVPFAAATREKQSALGHFEPENVLASRGPERQQRRKLNEATLETGCQMHSMAAHFAMVVDQEIGRICETAAADRKLDWDRFFPGWMRMVRRIVLGDAAADDTELTDLLEQLRYRANYAFLRAKALRQRRELLDRLHAYVEAAALQSLVGQMAAHCTDRAQMPHHQLPQYLFAFDPGAMATFRTLGMLSVDASARERVRSEIDAVAPGPTPNLPFLRACYLETLRLWPTTPAILRETEETIAWSEGQLETGTHITVFTPFLHRDDETVPDAHTFQPARWIGTVAHPETGLVPFSFGPVQCPAAHFVPMIATLAMRRVLNKLDLQMVDPQRLSLERLPGTLDNFTLRFAVSIRADA